MNELKSLADLQPHPRNPREITPAALAGLGASIEQYGDLSGVTWNARNGLLVCGHQRRKALPAGSELIISPAHPPYIQTPSGPRLPVRVVDWDEEKHLAAMVVANNPHIAGQWLPELGGRLDELAAPLGDMFFDLKLNELRADVPPAIPNDNKDIDEDALGETHNECPKCGFQW